MADRLRDQGFEVIEAFNADRFALGRARQRFLDAARGADLALFYFAGHGIQLFDRNVLIARDAEPSQAKAISELGLDMTQLMTDLRAAGPVRAALLIDACRDNPLGFEETVALIRRLGTADGSPQGKEPGLAVASRGLGNVALPADRGAAGAGETLVFFAAQPGHVSYDGAGQNSYFVEGLREALARTDRPFSAVLREAGAYVRTVTQGKQVPQLVSDWTADPVLGRASTAAVRYLNTYRANDAGDLDRTQARAVGEASRAWPVFQGTFIVRESQAFTDSHREAGEAQRARARAIGSVNGFALDYDIDRDGRTETIAAYVLQTNVVLEVIDEGVTLRELPCWDFGGKEVEAVEIALRDINGDRRPEIFIHYRTELGSWGNLCVLQYVGAKDMASRRRARHQTDWAQSSVFRLLLRHEGAWTVTVGEDNSIETCAGSNCHTRSSYRFDGTWFRMSLDESEQPTAAKAKPFRDEAERQRTIAAANSSAQSVVRSSPAPASIGTGSRPHAAIEQFVAADYLASADKAANLLYEDTVAYYGTTKSRAAVQRDKKQYNQRWPQRRYALAPGSLVVRQHKGKPAVYDVSFDYTFDVSDGKRRSAGRGRTRLTLRQTGQRFWIASEAGEVISRR